MYVFHKDAELQNVGMGLDRRIMAYDEELMLVEVTMDTGAVGALHTHPHHQVDYLVSGCVEFELEGDKRIMRAGDSVVIPQNAVHGARALEPSVLLDIFAPMRKDFIQAKE